jgi:hypothetical protein
LVNLSRDTSNNQYRVLHKPHCNNAHIRNVVNIFHYMVDDHTQVCIVVRSAYVCICLNRTGDIHTNYIDHDDHVVSVHLYDRIISCMVVHNVDLAHDNVAVDYDHKYKQQVLVDHMDNEIVFEDMSNMYLCKYVHIPIRQYKSSI